MKLNVKLFGWREIDKKIGWIKIIKLFYLNKIREILKKM